MALQTLKTNRKKASSKRTDDVIQYDSIRTLTTNQVTSAASCISEETVTMQKKQDKYPGVYPRGEFFEIKVAFYDPTEKKKVRVSYSNNFATAKQAFEAREQAMCEIRVNGIPEFYRKRMAESDTNVLNNSMTMAEFLTYWYENVHRPTIAPYTAVGDEVDIRVHMIPAFGDVKICHLTSKHLQKLFEHMRTHPSQGGKGLKFNTADHVRRVLSKALNWAIKKRLIDENYATDAYIQPDESAFEASVLNTEQAKALINALNKEPVFGLALKLQLLLGVRVGEALAIRFSTIVVKRQVCLEKPRKETPDGKEVWGIKEKLKSDRGGKSRNRQLRALPIPAWLTQEIKSQQIKYKTNKLKYGKDFIDSDLVTCEGV